MATYNIYGIGAVLADTEVEVSDSFLASPHIDRGVMTLANDCAARVVAQFGTRLKASELGVIKEKFGL